MWKLIPAESNFHFRPYHHGCPRGPRRQHIAFLKRRKYDFIIEQEAMLKSIAA